MVWVLIWHYGDLMVVCLSWFGGIDCCGWFRVWILGFVCLGCLVLVGCLSNVLRLVVVDCCCGWVLVSSLSDCGCLFVFSVCLRVFASCYVVGLW